MLEYYVPTGEAEAELTEKRSRFIGHIFPVTTEEEARACIESVKKKHYDARHNCWCYRLHTTGAERYSDDGEPQGTAGQPMLNVFQREQIEDVCCVVTSWGLGAWSAPTVKPQRTPSPPRAALWCAGG